MHASLTPWLYSLSLHDALPISEKVLYEKAHGRGQAVLSDWFEGEIRKVKDALPKGLTVEMSCGLAELPGGTFLPTTRDRKSTRLNSSHITISYAVFCLKKKRIC